VVWMRFSPSRRRVLTTLDVSCTCTSVQDDITHHHQGQLFMVAWTTQYPHRPTNALIHRTAPHSPAPKCLGCPPDVPASRPHPIATHLHRRERVSRPDRVSAAFTEPLPSGDRHAIAGWRASIPNHPTLRHHDTTPPQARPPPAPTPTKRIKILFQLEAIKAKGEQCHHHIRVPNKEQAEPHRHQTPATCEDRSGNERRGRRKRRLRRKMSTRITKSFMSSTIPTKIPRRDGNRSGRVAR